jgi:hypothetical protein
MDERENNSHDSAEGKARGTRARTDRAQEQAKRRLSADATHDQPNRGDSADVLQGGAQPGTTVGDGS